MAMYPSPKSGSIGIRNLKSKAIHVRTGIFTVLTLLVGFASPAFAQDQDEQLWVKLSADAPLMEYVGLSFEVNQRLGNAEGGLFESQYLASVGFEIAHGIKLTGAVNRVVDLEDGQVAATEWRPRQQVNFPIATIGKGAFEGQIRLEQRFRSDGNDVGHRLRPKVVYNLPLGPPLELEFGHESYFNLNTTDFGQQAGHERMRNFAEVGFPVSGKVRASLGYLNQYRFNGSERDLMEHALTSGLSISFE